MSCLANSKVTWPSPMLLQSRAACVCHWLQANKESKPFQWERRQTKGEEIHVSACVFASGFSANYKNYY